MAITGSYSTATGVDFNLVAYYSYTQDVSANTSNVTVTLKLKHRSLGATALSDSYLSVAGNKVSYSGKYISQSSNTLTETTLASKTVTVKHASDGKGSCAIKATFVLNGSYSGKSIGTLTLNNTLTLKTIPRASGLSVPSSVNTGSTLKVSITPSSSSFGHKVRFIVDGVEKYTSDFIAQGTTSYSYKIPHSWSPDKSSKTMTVRLYTYNGNTLIANADKTTTINVPSTIVPKVNSVSASLVTGLDGQYVQGKSKVKLTVKAESGEGSELAYYYYKGANITSNASSYTSTASTQTSVVIQTSGKLTYQVRVKDKRGRYSEWVSTSINVQSYANPKITSIKAQRCLSDGTLDNNGEYAKVTVKTSHASVNGVNAATVKLTNSKDDYATATQIISSVNTSNTYSGIYGGGFNIDNSYTISATVTDEYNSTHTLSTTLKAAQRSLNIAKYGNGVAVGKLSSVTSQSANGQFECAWNATFNENVRVHSSGSKVLEVLRFGVSDDVDQDGINETANVAAQLYINDSGNVTCRRRFSVDNGDLYSTQGYWQLRDNDMYVNEPLTVDGIVSTNTRFGFNGNYSDHNFNIYGQWKDGNNHDILVRNSDGLTTAIGWVGDDNHETVLDIRPKKVNVRGDMYIGDDILNAFLNGSNEPVIQSLTTYDRTYDASPNMYITSNGVFGRTTSSSQRYKTDIQDVTDENLNPYKILQIPVRQYKYNKDNIPIGKQEDDVYLGMIAEEVAKVYPAAAEYNEDGQVEMWNIKVIVPALLKIVQDQQKEIQSLKEQLKSIIH